MMGARTRWLIAGLILLTAGCASAPRPYFEDGPVVTRVHDDRDIPEPEEAEFHRYSHHIENFVLRQARLGLDPTPPAPARDVNRLGEVVDSSWFTNRIDDVDAAMVGRGAGGDDPGPEAFRPWTVVSGKSGGVNPGFVFADSRGARYIAKFDKTGEPIVSTAAGAIACRLFWAVGYNCPDDRVVYFRPDELSISPDATVKNAAGEKRPLTRADIDAILDAVPGRVSGEPIRALTSRYLDGRPVGGYAYAGTRDDDPNDTIPHQKRRSLRGLRVFGAWLNHVDEKLDNCLDVYVEEDGRRFLRHYLVDFDACLGGHWSAQHELRIGFSHEFDWNEFLVGLPTLGLVVQPYEDLGPPEHPMVGLYESEAFDPAIWKPNYVNNYFHECADADAYWAGTLLAKVSDAMIDSAVAAARYPDPAAVRVVTRVLRERRDETLRWALTRVTPVVGMETLSLDAVAPVIEAEDLSARNGMDLGLEFEAVVRDREGVTLGPKLKLGRSPRIALPPLMEAGLDYLSVAWTAIAPDGRRLPASEGHYVRDESGWRLIGILRDGQ